MLVKGIGLFLVILMIASVKSSYNTRAMIFVVVAGGLLYLAMSKGRR